MAVIWYGVVGIIKKLSIKDQRTARFCLWRGPHISRTPRSLAANSPDRPPPIPSFFASTRSTFRSHPSRTTTSPPSATAPLSVRSDYWAGLTSNWGGLLWDWLNHLCWGCWAWDCYCFSAVVSITLVLSFSHCLFRFLFCGVCRSVLSCCALGRRSQSLI